MSPAASAGEDIDPPTVATFDVSRPWSGVLEGDIRIHNHCYMADEMAQMIDMSKEFGYEIAAFHHAVEALQGRAHAGRGNDICASHVGRLVGL